MTDLDLARALAEEAGRVALAVRASGLIDGKDLGKAGDRAVNAFLVAAIAQHRPDDAILSEESEDDHSRLDKDRVWIIDPVDGTREYSEGRTDWAVHVGLAVDGIAHTGAVALPGLQKVLDSEIAAGSTNSPTGKIVVSRSHLPSEAAGVATELGMELVAMGSAGAKAMTVVRGEVDAYLHSGGQYEWDNCAPVAVAQAHGLHCSRIDGAPLRYNRQDVRLPDLLICRTELAERILQAISA